MSREIHDILLSHYETLNAQYEENLEAVHELQRTLILQILPGLVDELALDEESEEYSLSWLEDECKLLDILVMRLLICISVSIFRLLRVSA